MRETTAPLFADESLSNSEQESPNDRLNRRHFLAVCSMAGLSGTLMPGVLWGMAAKQAEPQQSADKKDEKPKITKEMIGHAATIAGVEIKDEYIEMMLEELNGNLKGYKAIYDLRIPNSVAPCVQFEPVLPGMKIKVPAAAPGAPRLSNIVGVSVPRNLEDAAFYSVRQWAELVRTRKVSSSDVTKMYLERLKKYDPKLFFVISLTEDRALAQAKEADKDVAAGKYRGPLHGLPWGAKDLLAVKGYKTTWGAGGFEDHEFPEDAAVVKRLDAAGAVLVAKLTLGALAMGDYWFGKDHKGERTRNPWLIQQGSSGSSAGPASAVSSGCVAFAIGSETLGSISSPSTRTGTTGLRPTFGRIPRTGAMSLSWTMDKLGPICRAVEDTALVLQSIYGPDNLDGTVHNYPFAWNPATDVKTLRVGVVQKDFDTPPELSPDVRPEDKARMMRSFETRKNTDDATLDVLRNKLGIKLIPIELPKLPWEPMIAMLAAEAAAAFDDLTRSGRDTLLNAQTKDDWPNSFRIARFIPAVEYVQAARARRMAMEKMAELFKTLDCFVAPTDSDQLVITNLTGYPAVILPNGFRPMDAPLPTNPFRGGGPGTPLSVTFVGNLYREDQLCALAKAYQDATDFHLRHPRLE
jgi:Asp-tRNA(Asn)/Glu-tRNA(Gln) amidotransferase A subunit family amidase